MKRWTKQDHTSVMFRDCDRCIGGRVFWGKAEPQWQSELGYVGTCCMCGAQCFTQDLLSPLEAPGRRGWHRNAKPDYVDRRRAA